MCYSKNELCQQIEDAFLGVEYPGDNNIALREPPEDGLITRGMLKAYRGKDWKQIVKKRVSWFEQHYPDLVAFSPEAYRFYLPAFLVKCVTNPDKVGLVLDWLVYGFSPPESKALSAKYHAYLGGLSLEQRAVVVNVLRFLRQKYSDDQVVIKDIDNAINSIKVA